MSQPNPKKERYLTGTSTLEELTPEELELARELAQTIKMETTPLLSFGVTEQDQTTRALAPIVREVTNSGNEAVQTRVFNMLETMQKTKAESILNLRPGILSNVPIIGTRFDPFNHFVENFEKNSQVINEMLQELRRSRTLLLVFIHGLDVKQKTIHPSLQKLKILAAAAEIKLLEWYQELDEREANPKPGYLYQEELEEHRLMIDTLEARHLSIKTSTLYFQQSGPVIRMAKTASIMLAHGIQDSLFTLFPVLQTQVILQVGLHSQQKALRLKRALGQGAEKLLLENAEQIRRGTAEVIRESQRPALSPGTLRATNEKVLATLRDMVTAQAEANATRVQAEMELREIQEQLEEGLEQIRRRSIEQRETPKLLAGG